MNIDVNILATVLAACLGAVGWLFKTTSQQAKDIVILQTQIGATNSQVAEIKRDIQAIRTDLERSSRESNENMIQMLEAISNINTNIARITRD